MSVKISLNGEGYLVFKYTRFPDYDNAPYEIDITCTCITPPYSKEISQIFNNERGNPHEMERTKKDRG